MKTTIVITVDGLNARFLGAYGNTWVQTPHLDQLASQSTVGEYFFAQHPDKSTLLNRLRSATILTDDANPDPDTICFAGFSCCTLVTDDEQFANSVGESFDSVEFVQGSGEQERLDSDVDDATKQSTEATEPTQETETKQATEPTQFDRLFSVAASILETQTEERNSESLDSNNHEPEHQLFWFHSQGMLGTWDAPTSIQQQYKDESDPPPRRFDEAPCFVLQSDSDPDQRTEVLHAYGAEVRSLDESIGNFFAATGSTLDESLLIFCGLRGFPLG